MEAYKIMGAFRLDTAQLEFTNHSDRCLESLESFPLFKRC